MWSLQAVNILEKRRLKDEEEEKKWKPMLVKLYLNQSLCSIRMKRPKLAIVQCRSVLELEEKNVKAIFRMGQVWWVGYEFSTEVGVWQVVLSSLGEELNQ